MILLLFYAITKLFVVLGQPSGFSVGDGINFNYGSKFDENYPVTDSSEIPTECPEMPLSPEDVNWGSDFQRFTFSPIIKGSKTDGHKDPSLGQAPSPFESVVTEAEIMQCVSSNEPLVFGRVCKVTVRADSTNVKNTDANDEEIPKSMRNETNGLYLFKIEMCGN